MFARKIAGRARAAVAIAAAAAVTVAGLLAADTGTAWAARRSTGPRLVAVNPHAAAQPTASGRRITELAVWNGRVVSGYGDWGANTGPISISSVDPATGQGRVDAVSDTEAVHNLRPIQGKLFAPAIDPRIAADYASDGPWADRDAVDATHVFDMATLTGTDLWMVGSSGMNAVAWRSLDGGTTWSTSLVVPASSGMANDFARFYFAGVLNGRLYVQACDWFTGAQPSSHVFDGTGWSSGPSLLPSGCGWQPTQVGSELLLQSNAGPGVLLAFNGTSARIVVGEVADFTVVSGDVYVLDTNGNVQLAGSGLRRWRTVARGLSGSTSLAVSPTGTIFVGTRDSAIYQLR